jgi:hypothetical protein
LINIGQTVSTKVPIQESYLGEGRGEIK